MYKLTIYFSFKNHKFYSVYAIVKILIFTPSIFCNSFAQASKVAPVVITSSINKICLPLNFDVLFNWNLVSLLLNRSKRALKVWVFHQSSLLPPRHTWLSERNYQLFLDIPLGIRRWIFSNICRFLGILLVESGFWGFLVQPRLEQNKTEQNGKALRIPFSVKR